MSKPTPDVYEQGKGMDAHNQVMREIRSRKEASYDPHEPTRVWLDEDNTPDGVKQSLTIILNTGGCRWPAPAAVRCVATSRKASTAVPSPTTP